MEMAALDASAGLVVACPANPLRRHGPSRLTLCFHLYANSQIDGKIADTKTRVYLRLVVSFSVLWCANLLTDQVIQSRSGPMGYVRDVGVEGSNPVTPTTDSWVHSGHIDL